MKLSFCALPLLAATACANPIKSSTSYEVWAADQSNTEPGQIGLGVLGSYLWIWDSESVEEQVATGTPAVPLSCSPDQETGPCDVFTIFPKELVEYDKDDAPTGNTLGDLPLFGRLHGALHDPQNRYVNMNLFARGGGYVGIVDAQTKEAIALFRVTEYEYEGRSGAGRSVHMSTWSEDGNSILIANLHGKAMERINIVRDSEGTITNVSFDTDASLGLGKGMSVLKEATYFQGSGAFGTALKGNIVGSYQADLTDTTPNGVCKENDCGSGDGDLGGRPNNLPICSVTSDNDLVYITLAGGGLLVADHAATPMQIVGEYGNNVVYGAGCGGVSVDGTMFLNAGISASSAGATQSMFTLWAFDNGEFLSSNLPQNTPTPFVVYEDGGNTKTGGNMKGLSAITDGQIPGETSRRDSHGAASTANGLYIHVVDRIQNKVEVFNTRSVLNNGKNNQFTYDLTSSNVCLDYSVNDDAALPLNDPAPDLMEESPDGEFMMIAFRGPTPVSVSHSAQGSCPGVGVVKLSQGGKNGELATVLRTTNTITDDATISVAGGVDYAGDERSDVHGVVVVDTSAW